MDTEVQACAALALAASGLLVAKTCERSRLDCPPSGGFGDIPRSGCPCPAMRMVMERSDGLVSR
jgi:hypothetical protein